MSHRPVCAIEGQSEPGFQLGDSQRMLPGEMDVTLYVMGESGAGGQPGRCG